MQFLSEYNTKPRKILVCNPVHNRGLQNFSQADISQHNFQAVADQKALSTEFDTLITELKKHHIVVIDVAELVEPQDVEELESNPNSMFTRDSLITIPWLPQTALVSRMRLPGRQSEPHIIKKAAAQLGISEFFEPPENVFLEGGDVIAVTQDAKRTLFIGAGSRTTASTARWLAHVLIPKKYVDEIVCLSHDRHLLHLDTCFAVLPNQTAVCAAEALKGGFIIDQDLNERPIHTKEYLKTLNYHVVGASLRGAASDEDTNLLFVGDNQYLSFKLPNGFKESIERIAKITITEINGTEICKANGGIHCLTRPIY